MNSETEQFLAATTFGVAGASSNRTKYGNKVLRCYLQNDRSVIAIHPSETDIEGQRTFASLIAAPAVESLSIITPPAVTDRVVDDAIAAGVKHLWMQPGAESQAAIDKARTAGLTVIAGGPCLLVVLGFHEEQH